MTIRTLYVSAFLMYAYTAQAFAAGSEEHGQGHHETSGGLPQLDATTYPSQIFWLLVVFVVMYIFFSQKSLPEISGTIEGRAERIANDLDSADRLRKEVKSVQESYEKSLSGAREKSSSLFSDMEREIKERFDKRTAAFQDRAAREIHDMEESIASARAKAMEEMSSVAAQIAAESVEKITGIAVDEKYTLSIVGDLVTESQKKAA